MAGGSVEIDGTGGDWAGAEMRGGFLRIRGNTGDFLGAAYPGSRLGMREGVILVEGSAGDEVGSMLRRGLIAIRNSAGLGLGRGMIAGTILALGEVGRQPGAGMKRGTLVLPSLSLSTEATVLPTFVCAGRLPAPFLALYYAQLAAWGFAIPATVSSARLERYNGDMAVGGQGEILAGRRIA
jgi:formylmethanofuran dehydrogenase subunit C